MATLGFTVNPDVKSQVESIQSTIEVEVFYAADGMSAMLFHPLGDVDGNDYIIAVTASGTCSTRTIDGWETGWEA